MKTALILNGPNLNLLGSREPAVYGSSTLADIRSMCDQVCSHYRLRMDFRQSNQEGVLIDALHEAGESMKQGQLAGVVLNAGAYTHTSIALADAIRATGVSVIELHISNVFARESFRHHSFIAPVAKAVICGLGVQGYALAIAALSTFQPQAS